MYVCEVSDHSCYHASFQLTLPVIFGIDAFVGHELMFTRLFKKCLQNKEHLPAERAESFRPFQNDTRATDRHIIGKHPERARLTKKGFAGVANRPNNLQVQEQIDGAASGHDICFHYGGQVPRVPQDKSRVYGNVSGFWHDEDPGLFWYPRKVVDTESDEFWVGGIALGNEQCCETYTLRTYDRHCSREFICCPC